MGQRVSNRQKRSPALSLPGIDSWSRLICDKPMLAVGAAAATGFFAGGGGLTIPGRMATSIVARMVARELAAGMVTGLLASMFAGHHDNGTRETED